MTKLCPRGKAAAKRKFKVYPSAYANAYASKICAGKIKDPSGVKRKDFRGRKPAAEGGPINKMVAVERRTVLGKPRKESLKPGVKRTRLEEGRPPKGVRKDNFKKDPKRFNPDGSFKKIKDIQPSPRVEKPDALRRNRAGGGLMEATARLKRQGLGMGGSVCKIAKRGQNRDAIGKNS